LKKKAGILASLQSDLKITISVLFLASVFTTLIFLLLPVAREKYRLSIELDQISHILQNVMFEDLDNDGNSEFIRFKTENNIPALVINTRNFNVIGQINLHGSWTDRAVPVFSDFDNDGFREVICCTWYHDSIWLHVIEPLQKPGGTIRSRAIISAPVVDGLHQWDIRFGDPVDMNNDGCQDLVLSFFPTFTKDPRLVYIYDIAKDSLRVQQGRPSNNILKPVMMDLDGDGIPEITGNSSAPNNFGSQAAELSDSLSWLIVYNNTLEFIFPPVGYSATPSYIDIMPISNNGRQLLVVLFNDRSNNYQGSSLCTYRFENDSLIPVSSKVFPEPDQYRIYGPLQDDNQDFYLMKEGEMLRMNSKLEIISKEQGYEFSSDTRWQLLDIDKDRKKEIIGFRANGEIVVYQSNFRHPSYCKLNPSSSQIIINTISGDKRNLFLIYSNYEYYILEYAVNPIYRFRFLVFIGILIFNLFIFGAMTILIKRRYQMVRNQEKELLHYQLVSVQKQLSPHFLFNVLNNISQVFSHGKKDEAMSYVTDVSRLVVSSMENAEKLTISLDDELSFVSNYLFLEKFRSNDRFDFSIEIEEGPHMQLQVPKMLIQHFAENALKHGLFHMEGRRGKIRIYMEKAAGAVNIIIEDNGIGRKKAAELQTFGTRTGLKNTDRILVLVEELTKVNISYIVEDLYDENAEGNGTRVKIEVLMR